MPTYNRKSVSANLINRIVIVLSAFGLFVTGILSYSHLSKKEVPCAADAVVNCAAVVNSPYGSILGIPVAYLGFAAYLILFLLSLYRSKATGREWERSTYLSLLVTGIGFGVHVFLQVISITVIQQLCEWCLTSAVNMLVLFVLHGLLAQAGEPVPESRKPKLDQTIAIAAVILALGAFGVVSSKMQKEVSFAIKGLSLEGKTLADVLPAEGKQQGDPDAKVTIIEFADVFCPSCRQAAPRMEAIYNQYDGRLRWAYRHFPLINVPGHETTFEASILAEYAADNGKFWDYLHNLMLEQNESRAKTVPGLLEIAKESGLDVNEIREDLHVPEESRYFDRVNEDFHLATSELKLKGTPTFILFVEGREPVPLGSISEVENALKEPAIQALLK